MVNLEYRYAQYAAVADQYKSGSGAHSGAGRLSPGAMFPSSFRNVFVCGDNCFLITCAHT